MKTSHNSGALHEADNAIFDIDFSLAMHNRTGKYFIGRDIIDNAGDLLGDIFYYQIKSDHPPTGLAAKIVCRIQGLHTMLNAKGGILGHQVRPGHRRPILHFEPYTVLSRSLRRHDAVIVHDTGPITHPDLFEQRLNPAYDRIFAELAEVGPHLIFVSRASQHAFELAYPQCRPASTRVLYPAMRTDIDVRTMTPVAHVGDCFILTTGSLGDRKNQSRAIQAFAKTDLAARGVQYVLCGAKEPGADAVAEIAARTSGVILLSYVSDEELAWLYGHASGFVLPSLLEGFGIPLAEAIEHGAVPLISADSVLEEVAGEGALTCDPLSIPSIADGMTRLIDMTSEERETRLTSLHAAIARFTIEKFRNDWRQALVEMTVQAQPKHRISGGSAFSSTC